MVNSFFKSKKYRENIYDQQAVVILISLSVKSCIRPIRCVETRITPRYAPYNFQIINTFFRRYQSLYVADFLHIITHRDNAEIAHHNSRANSMEIHVDFLLL